MSLFRARTMVGCILVAVGLLSVLASWLRTGTLDAGILLTIANTLSALGMAW